MNFDIKKLPYNQFEQLGMSKKDVLTMDPHQLADMLHGKRSGLIPLTISLGEGMSPIRVDAKLSLSSNPDGTLSVGVHPILAKPTNSIGATPEQWDRMIKGEPVVKDSKSLNGTIEPHIHQIDKHTNEVLSARISDIKLPSQFNNIPLSPANIEQLKKGLLVLIDSKTQNEVHCLKLDLNEPKAIKLSSREVVKEIVEEKSHNLTQVESKSIEKISRGRKM